MPRDPSTARFYETPAGRFPSVTTILQATRDTTGLDAWRERVGDAEADRIRDAAIFRGNLLDEAMGEWLADLRVPSESDPVRPWWDSLAGIREDLAPFLPAYAIQHVVYHPGLRYAGTLDAACLFRSHHCVIDWKSADKPKPREYARDYELQVAAYAVAAQRCLTLPAGVEIDGGLVAIAIPGRTAQEICMGPSEILDAFAEFTERCERFWAAQ
jgi:hypothetical protein